MVFDWWVNWSLQGSSDRLKPAEPSVEVLRRSAKWAKHPVAGSCKRVGDNKDVAKAVWEETVSQRDAGLDQGPLFSVKELDEKFPEGWIPSKRFGVVKEQRLEQWMILASFW